MFLRTKLSLKVSFWCVWFHYALMSWSLVSKLSAWEVFWFLHMFDWGGNYSWCFMFHWMLCRESWIVWGLFNTYKWLLIVSCNVTYPELENWQSRKEETRFDLSFLWQTFMSFSFIRIINMFDNSTYQPKVW